MRSALQEKSSFHLTYKDPAGYTCQYQQQDQFKQVQYTDEICMKVLQEYVNAESFEKFTPRYQGVSYQTYPPIKSYVSPWFVKVIVDVEFFVLFRPYSSRRIAN